MNNKPLQATMFEIGLSHADVIQAGLLSNPSLDGLLQFPTGGGNSTLEAGVLQSLFAIFRRPVAQRIAEAKLKKKILDAALLATKVATDTSAAYINALIAFRSQGVATENVMTARELVLVVKERLAAGVGTQLEVNAAEAELIEQEMLLEQAKLDVVSTELALSELLGSEGEIGSVTNTFTTESPPDIPYRLNALVELAEKSRLDVQGRQIQVKIAKEDLRLEKRRVLREMSVGASIESSDEGTEIGPALDIEIPLFDQNQAQVAKAKYRVSQAQTELDAVTLQSQNEVRLALSQYGVARQSVEFFEEKLVPLRTENLSLAREGFSEGKTGLLFVLESQRKLLQTRREYLARLQTYLNSITTIEKAVGLSLCQILRRLDVEEPTIGPNAASAACS
jgi:cobalt-zinc-cadmium efflux system outer membrane protein